jgi:hypothetical protein
MPCPLYNICYDEQVQYLIINGVDDAAKHIFKYIYPD